MQASYKSKVVKNLGCVALNTLFAFIFLGIYYNKIFRGKQIWIKCHLNPAPKDTRTSRFRNFSCRNE